MEFFAEQLVDELPKRRNAGAELRIVCPHPKQLNCLCARMIRVIDDREREPVHPPQVDAADFLAERPGESVRSCRAGIVGERPQRVLNSELPTSKPFEFAVENVVASQSIARYR
jgi:hypothetical protein